MAWTTPKTWASGYVVLAADLNTHVRDNFNQTAPAILTTAEDILVANAANAPKRLAIGTNGRPVGAVSGAVAYMSDLQMANYDLEAASELTISTGDITVTQTYHKVDTESDAASDNLDGINGGSAGRIIVLRPENDGRTVVVRHNQSAGAADNILLADDTDYSMSRIEDIIALIYDATLDTNGAWLEVSRSLAEGESANQIAFFTGACPTGWSEYTAMRGRYVVGTPSGGTGEGTVGTALSDQENRAVGQHTHTFTGNALGTHTHKMKAKAAAADADGPSGRALADTTALGYIYKNATPDADMKAGTNTSDSAGTPSGTNANSGGVAGTNAPYIQLTACQKD
tara:strand:+ start:1055 stop:2080 length:1026 start_codon:yes stop_codon:yes gene_type:complete